MSRKLTKDEFIQRSIAVHGNKYGYDFVEYKSRKEKVAIVCSKHGVFFQTAENHMRGQGCSKCKVENHPILQKMSFDEFERRARLVHSDKYEYDKDSYISCSSKLRITCPTHGEFIQLGVSHLRGNGCIQCSRERRGAQRRYTTEEYIKKASEIHCGKYDYSKVRYKKSHDKVTIICPIHGEFEQKAYEHLLGQGCPYCGGTKKHTVESFIEKAKNVHGDKYDYSLVDYRSNKEKVAIICKTHGVFYQTPNDHLYGKGCPSCRESHGEQLIAEYLTENNIRFAREKKFTDCKNRKALPFDFFISELNTCIEFQGKQHYESVGIFDKDDSLEGRQRRDQIKRDYCATNGIKLIEIRYDQDIEQEIKKQLQV